MMDDSICWNIIVKATFNLIAIIINTCCKFGICDMLNLVQCTTCKCHAFDTFHDEYNLMSCCSPFDLVCIYANVYYI